MVSRSKKLSLALIIVAIILIACGGLLDMRNKDRFKLSEKVGISKTHCWADGTFLAVVATWLLVWKAAS